MNFDLEHHIAELLYKSIRGELSDSEREYLEQWRSDSPKHEALFMRVQDDKYIDQELEVFINGEKKNSILWECIRENSILRRKRNLIRFSSWSTAAILLLIVGISLFMRDRQEVVLVATQNVLPGDHKAILLMDNGEKIELSDSMQLAIGKGILASDNQLEYGNTEKNLASVYHTLKIPRGGEYRLKLSDGTVVFLNSESELRYPVNFGANSREVELKGEAFFDVVTDQQRPFVVRAEQVRVKVLGTSFNVNTYDKDYIETVLVEGSIEFQINAHNQEWRIKPNELARFDRKNKTIEVKEVDVLPYVSWKEGYFVFKNQSMEKIMNIMARWYDIKIKYEDETIKTLHFTGDIKRHADISVILKALTSSVNVNYTLNGRELILYINK
ncbi:FecR family protein [Butyricimonas paravirosa]